MTTRFDWLEKLPLSYDRFLLATRKLPRRFNSCLYHYIGNGCNIFCQIPTICVIVKRTQKYFRNNDMTHFYKYCLEKVVTHFVKSLPSVLFWNSHKNISKLMIWRISITNVVHIQEYILSPWQENVLRMVTNGFTSYIGSDPELQAAETVSAWFEKP